MTVDEIKQQYSMRDIVQQYGFHISRSGFIKCPFHKEKTASMKIYKDSYHCFGCKESGDIFAFVMRMENCDFKTAYKQLGGTYKEQSDYQHKLAQYHAKKRKETASRHQTNIKEEKRQVIKDIEMYKLWLQYFPVFSDEHSEAIHKLEYLYYKLEYLMKEEVMEFGYC